MPLSALHGHGTGDLLDEIVARLPGRGERPIGDEAIRVAILGRPNVGKSSLLNALLGEERVIVSDVPGRRATRSTRCCERGDTTFVLVDTAGLRRKRRQRQGIEYYSELRALEAAERADVALVLVDASEGVVEQDLAVADVARKAGCSTLVVLSKWDITTVDLQETRGRSTATRCGSARRRRRLGDDGARARAAARPRRVAVREARGADPDAASSTVRSGAEGGAARPGGRARPSAQAPLRRRRPARGRRGSASSSTTRGSSRATTATGSRTSCARASSSQGVPVSIDFQRSSDEGA